MSASTEQIPFAPARDQPGDKVALLIIDMINPFDFSGAAKMMDEAKAAARAIVALRARADAAKVPVVYVNDNFGHWHSERSELVKFVGERLIDPALAPRDGDYFIIKPQFSGFYATNLQVLLPKLGVRRLVLTGVATDICVLFTAADAYMRDYKLWVPADTVAAEKPERHAAALELIERHLSARIAPSRQCHFEAWSGGD